MSCMRGARGSQIACISALARPCCVFGSALNELKRPAEWGERRKTSVLDDMPLVTELQELAADLPTYGYRSAWALLRRSRDALGQPRVNAKRVYRVMRRHVLLFERRSRHAPSTRRHDDKVAVDRGNVRWCSDGFEFRCDDGVPLRVVFALDCCDREAVSGAATGSNWHAHRPIGPSAHRAFRRLTTLADTSLASSVSSTPNASLM